ncbi:MAG: GntR family transcriptional regulator [Gemmobacter sp.]
MPEPVERQVYRAIRRGMMSGLVPPDAFLSGRALAQYMKVSVQPVRDALKRLEAERLIEGRPQSGFRLRGMTASEYWEIIEIRCRLEALAGRHVATRVTPALIDRLVRRNEAMALSVDPTTTLAANFAFHFAIYTEAGRPALLEMIENLWTRIGPILHQHAEGYPGDTTKAKHDRIIAALERRDADEAEAAIIDDLVEATHRIVNKLPAGPDATGDRGEADGRARDAKGRAG